MPYSCFLFAGEHSGDLHASALMSAMRRIRGDITFCGVGGPLMQREGILSLFPFEELQLLGVMEILPKLPSLWRRFVFTRDWIMRHQPDCVILVDYPGWNLRLGRALRKAGFRGRIIYYIAPTVWAWGKGRIKSLEKFADLVLLIFPFEQPFFAGCSFPAQFVGHPLLDRIAQEETTGDWKASCGVKEAARSLALFPGSRTGEVNRLFPRMLETAKLLRGKDPALQVMISSADLRLEALLKQHLTSAQLENDPSYVCVPSQYRYEMMQSAHSALAKSGTVTLELALRGIPSVVVYDLSFCNRLIAYFIMGLRLQHYCIVNIIAGKTVYPEWIKEPFKPYRVAQELSALHEEGEPRDACIRACRNIREQLGANGNKNASERAAEAILT